MSSTIDILFPQEKVIRIEDRDFVVREFHAKEFPAVVAIAASMNGSGQADIISALEANGDKVLRLVSTVTNQPIEVVERLRLPTLLRLIEAILEENLDFFVRQLPQAIQRLGSRVTGSMQSNS
jgi:predicted sugar kinase